MLNFVYLRMQVTDNQYFKLVKSINSKQMALAKKVEKPQEKQANLTVLPRNSAKQLESVCERATLVIEKKKALDKLKGAYEMNKYLVSKTEGLEEEKVLVTFQRGQEKWTTNNPFVFNSSVEGTMALLEKKIAEEEAQILELA